MRIVIETEDGNRLGVHVEDGHLMLAVSDDMQDQVRNLRLTHTEADAISSMLHAGASAVRDELFAEDDGDDWKRQ